MLGRDWMIDNKIRIYYDLGCLRIGNTYVPLLEDLHISSNLRLTADIDLKPQTSTIVHAKARNRPNFPVSEIYQVKATEKGIIGQEPGLLVANSVGKLNKSRRIPICLVNNTNKFHRIKRSSVFGTLLSTSTSEVGSLDKVISNHNNQSDQTETDVNSQINVPDEHRQVIMNLITCNRDLFATEDTDLGKTDTIKMEIDTGNHPPIKLKPYRTPLNNRKIVEEAVKDMLDAKIIRKSRSPWAFPVVIVEKKDKTKRFCIDFRKLNNITKKNSFPLPVIDDILAQLGKAKYFTALDLKSGYHQIEMDEKDKEKTAFTCHVGLFEYNKLPFRLANGPSIFQELMFNVLEGLDYCFAYIDDILIYSESLEEHLKHIQAVFDRLSQHGLKLKLKKCNFVQSETNYLGFVISDKGIKPDASKVEAIRNMPNSTTVKHVRSFLGMCSYYRRFLPNFSEIAAPLVALTKKYAKCKWSSSCQAAFKELKKSLTIIPLLAYPKLDKPYTLYTDASHGAIGACLTQECDESETFMPGIKNEIPIHFLSHKLSDTQTLWSTIEKEAYSIHFALQKLDHYLHNAEFAIKNDHKPLKYLLESPIQNKKIQLWALGIAGYSCKIEYIQGKANTCADLLSRPVNLENLTEGSDQIEPEISNNTFEIGHVNSNRFDSKAFAHFEQIAVDRQHPEKECMGFDIVTEQNKDEDIQNIKQQLIKGIASIR